MSDDDTEVEEFNCEVSEIIYEGGGWVNMIIMGDFKNG